MFGKRSLILIFFSIFFCLYAYAETDLNFDVPLPQQATLLENKDMEFGGRQVLLGLYSSAQAGSEVSKYYKDFFEGKEFNKILDQTDTKTSRQILRFKKEDLVVSISIEPDAQGGCRIVVAKYLQPAGMPDPEQIKPSVKDSFFALPKKDVPGEDLFIIPRPPQSVRMVSMNKSGRAILLYTTTLSVSEAVDFYKDNMPDKGWKVTNITAARDAANAYKAAKNKKSLGVESPFSDGENFEEVINDSYMMSFGGDNGKSQIVIFPNFMGRKLGSMVQITYTQG